MDAYIGNQQIIIALSFVVVQVMNALRAEHAVDLYRYKAERAKIEKKSRL